MKSLFKIIPGSWPALLALIFLCSCYEFVYITQEDDIHTYSSLHTKISISVINDVKEPLMPFFGILLPNGWQVANHFQYTQIVDGFSVQLGWIYFSHQLSMKMQYLEPAPPGYFWWVGEGTVGISKAGIYNVYPQIQTGNSIGTFHIEYMAGDIYNGLNKLRSEVKDVMVINQKTPYDLKLCQNEDAIKLLWKEPLNTSHLVGYNIYRNEVKINQFMITDTEYYDQSPEPGSYLYSVMPLYWHAPAGTMSAKAGICYAHKGPSIMFDGMDDKLIVYDRASLQIENSITLEAWIKPEYNENVNPCIISKCVNGTGYELSIINSGPSSKLKFALPIGNLTSNSSLYTGRWYHVAAVYDGSFMKLYINGKPDAITKASGNIVNNISPLVIGRSFDKNVKNNSFYGNIDEVRIWDIARTEQQIHNYYTKNLTGTEFGLVGYWQMQEGCNFSTCDISPNGNDGYLYGSCWCAKDFPYIVDTYTQYISDIVVPVKNHDPINLKPQKLELEFKINPMLLEFQGITITQTQLENYDKVMTFYNPNGTINIVAKNANHNILTEDVLVYINLKPLQEKVNTTLDFYTYNSDGNYARTFSGLVVASNIWYKSQEDSDSGFDIAENEYFAVNIYPDPGFQFLNVDLTNASEEVDLQVINIIGQVILVEKLNSTDANSSYKIDLTKFDSGIYLLSVSNNGKRIVKKFFVN